MTMHPAVDSIGVAGVFVLYCLGLVCSVGGLSLLASGLPAAGESQHGMSPRRDGVDGPRVGDDIDPEEIMPAIELGPAGANGSPMADSLDVSNTHGIPACGLNGTAPSSASKRSSKGDKGSYSENYPSMNGNGSASVED